MTVVLDGAGLELVGDAGAPPSREHADRPVTNRITLRPVTPRPIRRRASGFFIASPPYKVTRNLSGKAAAAMHRPVPTVAADPLLSVC
jgi:hypothetical protein